MLLRPLNILPDCCPRRRIGFSLIELLVVIGIIGVLVGVLIPAIYRVRRSADRVVCSARLRELVSAAHLQLTATKRFPAPLYMPAVNVTMPASVQLRLLNDVQTALRGQPVAAAHSVANMPPNLVCPDRLKVEIFHDVDLMSFGTPFWQTGYMYLGGVEETPSAGTVINPTRHALTRGTRRGVLWADTLTGVMIGGTFHGYAFYHFKGGVAFDAAMKVSRTRTGLDGQHRAWSDGSVEWVPGSEIHIDPAQPHTTAGYRITLGGVYSVFYYY